MPYVKLKNPFVDTLRWVLLGGVVGLLVYLGHLALLHEKEKEVDDHSSYASQDARR